MNANIPDMLRAAISSQVASDLAWTRQSRRGRWMVVEPGPSLPDQPRELREYIDARSEHRGRRFSSLSRARAFAREVGGHVERRGRRKWRSVSPWERATKMAGIGTYARLAQRAHLETAP